jgi:hypothetical protein
VESSCLAPVTEVLIDAMRIALKRSEQGDILEAVMKHAPLLEIRGELLEADAKAKEIEAKDLKFGKNEASRYLYRRYIELDVVGRLPQLPRRGGYKKIVLNGLTPTAMNPTSSIVNRVVIHGLIASGSIEYIRGEICPFKDNELKGTATFKKLIEGRADTDTFEVNDLDDIIIRHGPKGALKAVVGAEAAQSHFSRGRDIDELGRFQAWKDTTFEPPTGLRLGPVSTDRTETLQPVFKKHLEAQNVKFASLSVGRSPNEETPAFLVRLSSANAAEAEKIPSHFRRVPIIIEIGDEHKNPERPDFKFLGTRYRPLVCGISIKGGTVGSLGCFVETADGNKAFVTAGHVLKEEDSDNNVGAVYQPPKMNGPIPENEIGKVRSVITPERGAQNRFDIGCVDLKVGLDFVPCFLPHLQLPPIRKVIEIENSLIGRQVWIVGANSALKGIVRAISLSNSQIDDRRGGQLKFDGLFEVSDFGDERRLSGWGVSGGLVITSDGGAVGMIIAGSRDRHWAFPLGPALDQLGCRLIPWV